MTRREPTATGSPRQLQSSLTWSSRAQRALQDAFGFNSLAARALRAARGAGSGNGASGTTLPDLSLSDFEALVADGFRRQGYAIRDGVAEYSGGHRELLLTRPADPAGSPHAGPLGTDTVSAVVHVRYWQAWRVGAPEVRELIAAMAANGAVRGFLVVPGQLGREARHLADLAGANDIELVDEVSLQVMLHGRPTRPVVPEPPRRPASRGRFGRLQDRPPRQGKPRRPWRVPVRYGLRAVGILLAAAAILAGFDWITGLPDKRLAPPQPPKAAVASVAQPPGPPEPEPPAPAPSLPPAPLRPAPPGLGGFRSVNELDAAFEAFYVPPPGCAQPAAHMDIVECANHRIRARKAFMAADAPTQFEAESQAEPSAETTTGGDLSWEEEEAIRALVPPQRDSPSEDSTPWNAEPAAAPPASARPREPAEQDPAGTYAPYDPKASWAEP